MAKVSGSGLSITLVLIYSLYTRTLNVIIGWLSKTFQKFLDYLIIVAMIPTPTPTPTPSPTPSPSPQASAAVKKYVFVTSSLKAKHFNSIIINATPFFVAAVFR